MISMVKRSHVHDSVLGLSSDLENDDLTNNLTSYVDETIKANLRLLEKSFSSEFTLP